MNMVSGRGFPPGDLRVSDADRDRAVAELSEHFQTGRLTQEEFGDRSDRALRARTGGELAGLLGDLPLYPEAPAGPLTGLGDRWPSRRPSTRAIVLAVVAAVVVADVVFDLAIGEHPGHIVIGLPLWVVIIVVLVLRRQARR